MDKDDTPLVHARRLHRRSLGIAEEGEPADRPTATDETEELEVDIMSGGDVEILGISARPESSSAQRKDEARQPGSPSVFISSPRMVDPNPTTGVIGGKAPATEASRVELSSSLSAEESDFEDEVDYGDETRSS